MQTSNVIGRCRWQTTFDQTDGAARLQDFISQWSRTVLTDELNRCFSERCPADQTWRIDMLSLDLGKVALDDLAVELPIRLRACLNDALDKLLAQAPASTMESGGGSPSLQVLNHGEELADYFICFLQQGCAPWWFQGARSIEQMFDQWLAERAAAASDLIRDLGRSEPVRKRMVWQLGEARVRRIIHVLEPAQGDFICGYADQLSIVHARYPLAAVDNTTFNNHTWLNILTYLLVDRGTLFNTAAFIRAGIGRSAQQLGIAPAVLLEQMHQALRALQPMGAVSPVFFNAIKVLYQQERPRPEPLQSVAAVDYWWHWQSMLRHGMPRRVIEQDSVTYAQLFSALAQQDPLRMAEMLRREGGASSVRQGVLRHLDVTGLSLLTRLLAPQDHVFIMAHAEHTQSLAQAQLRDKKAVWQVLLAYLLSSGAHFNRRQLVRDTLRQLCATQRCDFDALLGLLVHSLTLEHPDHHGFELLGILRELQAELFRQQTSALPEPPDWRNMLDYLELRKRGVSVPPERLPTHLPAPQPTLEQWARLLLRAGCWQGAEALLEQQLAHVFWLVALDERARHLSAAQLLARMTVTASLRLNISLSAMLGAYREPASTGPQTPWQAAAAGLLQQSAGSVRTLADVPSADATFVQDQAGHYLHHPRLIEIARHLLLYGRPPAWLSAVTPLDLTRLLHDLFHVRPDYLPALLGDIGQQPGMMFRLAHHISFAWVLEAMRVLAPQQQLTLRLLEQFHRYLDSLNLASINRSQRQAVLLQCVLPQGLAGDWAALAPEPLAGRFIRQLLRQQSVSKATLQQVLSPTMESLSPVFRQALAAAWRRIAAEPDERESLVTPVHQQPKPVSPYFKQALNLMPMSINNSGLVLLQSYISPLFSRLELTVDDVFVSASAQRRAVHFLQFLVTGSLETPEQDLMLNKLLCGLALETPLEPSIAMTHAEKEVCQSLLNAVIDYWPDCGSTSVDGVRGNWLVRDGSLAEAKDHWQVIVQKRAYDLLLAQSPFSYSVIKLPWMEKAIYVTWPT